MIVDTWPCKSADGHVSEELAVHLKTEGSTFRVLVIPPLFAEHNLMRRQLVEVMRQLHSARVDCVLPDLPGQNESLEPLSKQTLGCWRDAVVEASRTFDATSILAVRSGALLVPENAEGWLYAAQPGAKLLKGMIRARVIASREAGVTESSDDLFKLGRQEGITLGGWQIGASMFGELEAATTPAQTKWVEIAQKDVGGPGLWLRAEPDENAAQAAKLAEIILSDIPEEAKASA